MLSYKKIEEIGSQLGIHKLGISQVKSLDSGHLDEWLNRGHQGEMSYMERNLDKRLDPGALVSGAKSIISIFVNYHQDKSYPHLDGVISKYARGEDYHHILKDILHDLAKQIHGTDVEGMSRKQRTSVYRVFVDSAPVSEKQWAVAAGIGWQGKHSNIISREYGSWGFLGEIVTTFECDQYSVPIPDYCGSCTACIDACPTDAIVEPYVVDGSKCISYATIELDASITIPENVRAGLGEWIFGCDICQEVCPWNRFEKPSEMKVFSPIPILHNNLPDFSAMEQETFDGNFKSTPLERPGLKGLQRNQSVKLTTRK